MMNRVWHRAMIMLLGSMLFFAGSLQAASLEKIEVSSKLGETFYAEVPLKLETDELVSKVFVEIAAPADYKIFEVYRDPILNAIRADVASDERGVRVELSSRSTINAPFFNLVLKIRYGRVSHFKKFPVFLDAPKTVVQAAKKAPQPSVQAVQSKVADSSAQAALTESAGKMVAAAQPTASSTQAEAKKQQYFDGWARIGRYGPIVRGDSLSTVAERLRIDFRYTRNQIMLALFEKNRASFDQDNMNLMKAGSFLQVPTAAEIEKNHKTDSYRVFVEHEQAWKKLVEEPRYAAVAEAQRTRYTKRVSVGKQADGIAAAPVSPTSPDGAAAASSGSTGVMPATVSDLLEQGGTATTTDPVASQSSGQTAKVQSETSQVLAQLQQQNEQLQQQLLDNRKNVEALNKKVDDVASAASKARIEKLEILMTRLQAELEKDRERPAATAAAGSPDWVLYSLIVLVLVLLGLVAVLMRREPAHPAATGETTDRIEPVTAHETAESKALAAAIEDEVAGIETGETEQPIQQTATIDSMPAFTDELSDTDTAELEPFDTDADAEQEPDPNVDYMAEADVYIRYGMDDEALQQLDMALKVRPDNVDAHIKKAELLLGKSDNKGFDETIAAATLTLAAVDLERFKASIKELGSETDGQLSESEGDQEQTTLPLDGVKTDDLDFDLSDMDVPDADTAIEESDQFETRDINEAEEMNWLNDSAFEGEAFVQPDQSELDAADQQVETQAGGQNADEAGGATQELDNLLTAFSESDADDVATHQKGNGATQHLDQLLGEFDTDEDDISFTATHEGFDETVIEQGKADSDVSTGDSIGIDTDHGATQELDSLLAEFADEEDQVEVSSESEPDGLDASFFEVTDDAGQGDSVGLDTDQGATQELDSLLHEFSDDDENVVDMDTEQPGLDADSMEGAKADNADGPEADDPEQGATQVLGHLLDEFQDDEEDKKE